MIHKIIENIENETALIYPSSRYAIIRDKAIAQANSQVKINKPKLCEHLKINTDEVLAQNILRVATDIYNQTTKKYNLEFNATLKGTIIHKITITLGNNYKDQSKINCPGFQYPLLFEERYKDGEIVTKITMLSSVAGDLFENVLNRAIMSYNGDIQSNANKPNSGLHIDFKTSELAPLNKETCNKREILLPYPEHTGIHSFKKITINAIETIQENVAIEKP